ncbi:MAG: acyl-protein synthetase [Bacteroidetes bacterium]|jgi:putative addiction module component (TIGR02574 family)|nr:acyl-protein synthetase [Bacteroidota bacterium]
MSLEEKLRLIELIWQDISVNEDQISVPESHKAQLEKRAQMVREGKSKFIDWEQAKKEIKKATR